MACIWGEALPVGSVRGRESTGSRLHGNAQAVMQAAVGFDERKIRVAPAVKPDQLGHVARDGEELFPLCGGQEFTARHAGMFGMDQSGCLGVIAGFGTGASTKDRICVELQPASRGAIQIKSDGRNVHPC